MPTIDVCITVDAEFDINWAFSQPEKYRPIGMPSMERNVDGRSEGLGFLLDTLGRYGLPATFFVEVLAAHYFGLDEIRQLTGLVEAHGHDVQLHAHPCWRTFTESNWESSVRCSSPDDHWAGMGANAYPLLREAKDFFMKAVGRHPIAFRPGNLSVDSNLYGAINACGIPVSSAVGLGVFKPAERPLERWVAPLAASNVLEIPVASYWERSITRRHAKSLTITGTSWRTMQVFLEWASRENISPVVILTHASEFADIVTREPEKSIYQANQTNQQRLSQLAAFLNANTDRFNATTFSLSHQCWQEVSDKQFTAPALSRLHRTIERFMG